MRDPSGHEVSFDSYFDPDNQLEGSFDPPRPTVWICSCGHEEAAHVENSEDGLWPCVATSECRCPNFEVWS